MGAPEASTVEVELGTHRVRLETGRIARQAGAAVVVREGDNVVLVTVVGAKEPRPGADFFPLSVEYREKMASSGRIPGSFLRREGRIADHEVLACRVIDRSLRPLFPAGYRAEVQVQATVFSCVESGDPESLALIGAGAALQLSDIPFDGPVIGARSAIFRDRTTLLPVLAEREEATAELIVSAGPQGLVMVEGEADEVADEAVLDHLLATLDALEPGRGRLAEWGAAMGRPKRAFALPEPDPAWAERVAAACTEGLAAALAIPGKAERRDAVAAVRNGYLATFTGADGGPDPERAAEAAAVPDLCRTLYKSLVRDRVLAAGKRLDGRGLRDIRPIWGEVGILPRAHGSAVFTRGETQALCTCTLGAGRDAQMVERPYGTSQRRFLLHYNFPPYSVGETRPLRGPGRREIGHGNLALRALSKVLPDPETFPYTIRVESDITESNGSSSMATVCGGCLALMDAGVPITRPVAGIAMGLVARGDDVAVLSDILGDEDHLGDMDFKVAGTARGITALQMDNKVGGLGREVLAAAIAQGRAGLDHVLGKVGEILAAPRDHLPAYAPQMHTLRIQPHLIGALIGPRGETIKGIQEATGATLSVDDTGLVSIYAPEGSASDRALEAVRQVAGEVVAGETYRGRVQKVVPFGVFVRIYGSAEGLVETDKLRGNPPPEGQEVEVRVTGVDRRGRISLEQV